MFDLVSIELYKTFKRPRSYIGPAAITLLVLLIQLALFIDGETYIEFITHQIEQSFFIEGRIINVNLVAYVILQSLIVQMPLLVTLVSGDLISGESASGTMRLLAARPYSRHQILWAKLACACIYTICLVVWLGILALGVGSLVFKQGDLVVVSTDHVAILRQSDVLWRFLAAFTLAVISLTVVTSLSILFSCYADNSIGPIIATMAIVIIFTIIGTMEVPLFDKVRPWLFTTHMIAWRNFFEEPLPVSIIWKSILIMVAHIALFISISLYYFRRKDILS